MENLYSIRIQGYKSIRDLTLDIRAITILIGANSSGKSNILSIFKLLNAIAKGRLKLAMSRGGGASSTLHYGSKRTGEMAIEVKLGPHQYQCVLAPAQDGHLIFTEERPGIHLDLQPSFVRDQGTSAGVEGKGRSNWHRSIDAGGNWESSLSKLAEKGDPASRQILRTFNDLRVYHFQDTSDTADVKGIQQINDNLYLREDGGNLAPFLYALSHTHPDHYTRIVETIQLVIPGFDDFTLRPMVENTNMMRLEWREIDSDYLFLAHQLSDGTLRFICLATLLLQPDPPDLIIIDEPELGLHPSAIQVLAALIGSASHRTHVIVATQSAMLVDLFEPEDVVVVDRLQGETTARRLNPEELESWLSEYSLSELWEMNILGGKPVW
ncbi:putative ATPase [Methanocalculus alkaliphilus]|uniref:AAA family ATPase n=1 Tax=Methanocalculus alkaliphilus TaxID=768730 RepID=UPI00209E1FEC|nr:AAA family ATPase [Methanocalculus alkaliphilus]MCP1715530.1 putative ATPase [Methanocalculus alkaliphilus]